VGGQCESHLNRGGFFIDPNQKETHEPNHREQRSRTCCSASGLERQNDLVLKRKDVLLDLGRLGHSRQYLQVAYMYDVGDKISDTVRGFYLQAEQVSVRIMRTRRGSLMPVKTRSGRGFVSLF
jgi:hypothetical protein